MTLNLWILFIGIAVVTGMCIGAKIADWHNSKHIKRAYELGLEEAFNRGKDIGYRLAESKYTHIGFVTGSPIERYMTKNFKGHWL